LAAGLSDFARRFSPRDILRTLTVWQMKDRAGTVGAYGVAPLLVDLLANSSARLHLIGHSYGSKVVLSAICSPDKLPRNVRSILLLQPAVSHLCFAASIPGTHRPGGYRKALERVDNPIVATFSANDVPLTKTFHLFLRRQSDLGDPAIAAGEPPSDYAALGGFGPRLSGEKLIDVRDVTDSYEPDFASGHRLYGIRATRTILGHGDISNESIWWALYDLVQHGRK
jgi:pimeloyl-ACP methyl ester carboxylesterase